MTAEKLPEQQKMTLWLIQLRWWGLLMMVAILVSSIYIGHLHMAVVPSFIIIAIAAAYNLSYPILLKVFPEFGEKAIFTFFRVLIDQVAITFVVHFTGGVESPFTMMYLLDLAAVAVGNFGWIAYILSGFAYLFYLLLSLFEAAGYISHIHLIDTPGTLYLSQQYVVSKSLALLFTGLMLVHIASYISGRVREKQREIEFLSNYRADFMNNVVHETKSPLTSIIGYSELLQEGKLGHLGDAQKNPVGIINRQAHRMLEMVNDLLGIARIESGIAKFEKTKASIVDIIDNVAEEEAPVFAAKRIELVREISQDLPAIYIDENKISEVITNLLSNAFKFSNEGGKIIISASFDGNDVLCSVRDEGLGIDLLDLPHVFEKFYRSGHEWAEKKGTGLGLALSKTIIEHHGGRIWASSGGRGEGAAINFTLPLWEKVEK